EQPSSQRLREARKKGQVAKSKMLSSSAVTFGGLFGFLAFAPESAEHFKAWTVSIFSRQQYDARAVGLEAVAMFARFAAPALVGALVASVIVGVASVGFQFNPEAVAPKFERLNPAEGF